MPGASEDDKDQNLPGGDKDKGSNPPADKSKDKDGEKDGEGEGDGDDLSSMTPEQYQAEIKKLRKESAARRTENKSLKEQFSAVQDTVGKMKQALGIEDDKRSPEEMANDLKAENDALKLELSINQIAAANGISADQSEFFNFLFHKELASLKDDEDMGDERIAELVKKAKGSSPTTKKTSTGLNGKDDPPPSGDRDEITVEKFAKMNPGEKGLLYNQNPALYNRLFQEAKSKRLV